MLKLEIGKYYKDRIGEVFGPLVKSSDHLYPFLDKDSGAKWTEEGNYYTSETDNADLVEEVNADGSDIVMRGYHLTPVQKGVYGELSKLQEEVAEIADAEAQGNLIMLLNEASDLYGALEEYVSRKTDGRVNMNDLKIMSDATKRAFAAGRRINSDAK